MPRSINTLLFAALLLSATQAFANQTVNDFFKGVTTLSASLTDKRPLNSKISDLKEASSDMDDMIDAVFYDKSVNENIVAEMASLKSMVSIASELDSSTCNEIIGRLELVGTIQGFAESNLTSHQKQLLTSVKSLCK